MAITVAMRTEVSQLYVALFGRAPDADGLGYWTLRVANGESMTSIANAMYGTDPARAYYPSFLTNQEIIASFYLNVLGRPADAEGLAYWTGKLNATGATPGSVITDMINVVAHYGGTDPAGLTSAALFNNKVEVAQFYGEHAGNISDATVVLATVTADHATVVAAEAAISAGTIGQNGVDLTLTTGQDTLNGTPATDVVHGIFGAADATLTAGDSIDLGAGTHDTLELAVDGAAVSAAAVIKNVEFITIQDTIGGTFDATLVENSPSIIFTNTLAGQTSSTKGGSLGSVYGLAGLGNLTVGYANTTGSSDNALVSVAGVGSSAANSTIDVSNGNTIEKVSIATTGTNFVTLVGGTSAATLNVTGDGTNTFALSGVTALSAVATIDASASTGTNTFALGSNFNTGTVVKGGAGTDTVSATLALATLSVPTFTGVEKFNTTWTAYGVLDLGSTTGLTTLGINDKGAGGTVTVQNAQSTLSTVNVTNVTTANDALKVGYASTSKGALTLNVGSTSATATAVDLGAVTISNSTSLQVNTLGALAHDMDSLKVTGNQSALGFNVAAGGALTTGVITATGNIGALNVTTGTHSYFSGSLHAAGKTIGDVTVNATGTGSEADLRISGGAVSIGNVTFNATGNNISGYLTGTTSGGSIGNITLNLHGNNADIGMAFSAGYTSGSEGVGFATGNIGNVNISVIGNGNNVSGGVNTHGGNIGDIAITVTGDGNDVTYSAGADQLYTYYNNSTATHHSGYYHDLGLNGSIGNVSMAVAGQSSAGLYLTASGGTIGNITLSATGGADIDWHAQTRGSNGWFQDANPATDKFGNIGDISLTIGANSQISGYAYTSGGDIGNVSVAITGANASGSLYLEADQVSGGYNTGLDSNDYARGGNIGNITLAINGDASKYHIHALASGGSIGNVAVSVNGNGASGLVQLRSHPIGSGSPGGNIGTVNVQIGDHAGMEIESNFDRTMGAVTVAMGNNSWFNFYASGGNTGLTEANDQAKITSMTITMGQNSTSWVEVSGFSGSVGATTATIGDDSSAGWGLSDIKGSVGAMTLNAGVNASESIYTHGTIGSIGNINFTGAAGSHFHLESDGNIGSVGIVTITGGDSASSAGVYLDNTGFNINTMGGVNASSYAGVLHVDLSEVGYGAPATAVGTTIRAGTGGSDIRGSEGSDNIFLGSGKDVVHFDTTLDANTHTDVIFNFTAGATKDVLDIYSAPTTLVAVNSTDTAHVAASGEIVRLVDIAGGQDITTAAGLTTALNAGGEFANVTTTASQAFTIITAASASATTFYVFNFSDANADGLFTAGEIQLIAQVNSTSSTIGSLVLGNFM